MLSPTDNDARIVALLHAYLSADYRWERDGHWHDIVIGLPTPGLELAYPEAGSFGLLSAWNPQSIPRDEATNRRQAGSREADPPRLRGSSVPASSPARHRTWRAPGWLVFGSEVGRFDALARRYGQLGTLWWRPGTPARLRMYAT